jgi:glutamate racemase
MHIPVSVRILEQGQITADSLRNYLVRHPEIENQISREGKREFLTTDAADNFNKHAEQFYGGPVHATTIHL